jgi:hypothetical protein
LRSRQEKNAITVHFFLPVNENPALTGRDVPGILDGGRDVNTLLREGVGARDDRNA